ncbi:MAG: hypothetical protein ACLRNQ_20865 [Flavonifractor plautii]
MSTRWIWRGRTRPPLLAGLKAGLDEGCVDFTAPAAERDEAAALCGEDALERYLEDGALDGDTLTALIARRRLFPCWFGSALKLEGGRIPPGAGGVRPPAPVWPRFCRPGVQDFPGQPGEPPDVDEAHRRRPAGEGGPLRPRLDGEGGSVARLLGVQVPDRGRGPSGKRGGRHRPEPHRRRGGPWGRGGGPAPALEPVLTYQVLLPEGQDPHAALGKLRLLEEEDPQLHLVWNERLREIHIQLMGEVQLEILQALAAQRFGLAITFGPGGIVYRETIAAPVEGVGHYEPLRHYAEVHLLLEPLPGERPGAGRRLPPGHAGRELAAAGAHPSGGEAPPGVLTGSPITDVRITLVAGRAHLKHTEGATSGRPPTGRCARASWRRRASCWSRGTTSGWSRPGAGGPGPVRPPAHGRARPARRRPPGR